MVAVMTLLMEVPPFLTWIVQAPQEATHVVTTTCAQNPRVIIIMMEFHQRDHLQVGIMKISFK